MKTKKLLLIFIAVVISTAPLLAQTYSFTNAGASGTAGPSQSQVNSAYTSTNLAGQVTVIGSGIQEWTVPATGNYIITAAGASGGYTPNATGGRGRTISTRVSLTAGTVIRIVVGQEGGRAHFADRGYSAGYVGGGGGGSYVINQTTSTPILVSGGGGGAGEGGGGYFSYSAQPGVDASAYNNTSGESGTGYSDSWSSPGAGGTSGSGGSTGSGGAGGGGYSGNGSNASYSGNPGISFTNGGLGGTNRDNCGGGFTLNTPGGFGGGAGAGICYAYEANGGGGGGYSGGGGSNTRVGAGGGGGNYVTGSYISSSQNTGNGYVNIVFDCSGTVTSISATPSTQTNTGGVPTNLYIGYPNNTPSVTLNANGGANSTSWSASAYLSCTSCSTTVFTPTAAGTYTLTATCSGSPKSITICVKDIRVPNTSGSRAAVYMCHLEPGTSTPKTQAVLLRGIPSHFQYHSGDKLGYCGNTCATSKRDFDFETVVVDEQYLEVVCTPNPFRQSFKLHYISNSPEEATISIYGMTGNLVETVTLAGIADEAELGTNLPNGIYTVSFMQGDKNRVFRMIKVD